MPDMPRPESHPRLVYAGDVPVEASFHGSALLYRLLADWPADRLMIIECGVVDSQPSGAVLLQSP